MTVYAGCANSAIGELIDVVVVELKRMKDELLPEAELRRARVDLARDALAVRRHPLVRLLGLSRRHPAPRFFDIDDPTLDEPA